MIRQCSSIGIEDSLRRRHSERIHAASESLRLIGANKYGSIDSDNAQEGQPIRSISEKIIEEGKILKDELAAMISLSIPVIATYILEIIPSLITIFLVGRMDSENSKLYLDAAALGVMFYNIVGLSTGLGLLTALDTLCASAHGANQNSKMGKYLLTGIAIMTIVFMITGSVLLNTTSLLTLFQQPKEVAYYAGEFTLYMLPGLPCLYAYELLRKLSQARNDTAPMVVAAIVSVIVNYAVGYYLVNVCDWWLGAAVARTLGAVVLFPILFIGMLITDREFLSQVWSGFKVKEAITIKQMKKFLSLGVPGMLQVMFEWCAFEVIALLCGIFPGEQAIIAIGSNAVVFQISTFLFMFFLGASIAGNIRVGNALGSGDTHRAKVACWLTLFLGLFLAALTTSFLIFYRHRLPYLFTTDEDLVKKAESLFLVVGLYQLPDAINAVQQGIFKGIGKQALAAKLNFISYYVVGIPLGILFGFKFGWGVEGLWLGMTAGLCFASCANGIILYRCDWEELTHDTRKRLSIIMPHNLA